MITAEALRIPINFGLHLLIDADDWERSFTLECRPGEFSTVRPCGHKWSVPNLTGNRYCRIGKKVGEKPFTILLHRLIVEAPRGMEVDHRSGDTIDNRRCNLRVCDRSGQMRNKRANLNNRSGFKGVSATGNRWAAFICREHIGNYPTPEEAARAYDREALQRFGEFARLNFPSEAA